MTSSVTGDIANPNDTTQQQNDKEVNFARLRQERERIAYELDRERQEKQQLLEEMERLKSRSAEVEDDDSEPYVDSRKLKKVLSQFEERMEKKAEEKARRAVEEERNKNYMQRLRTEYRDFDEVLTQESAQRLEKDHPGVAAKIMNIQDEALRREMAYEAIKSLQLHKPKPQVSAQETVQDNKRKAMYYTPATVGTGAAPTQDFSPAGKKAAYERIQAMKRQGLR